MIEPTQPPSIPCSLLLLIFLIIPYSQSATCSRQRCCSLTTCTTLYCQQQSSQTWISTQSYNNYQYTKLVMISNQCKPCAYNCKRCTSQSLCNQCYDGYYMDNSGSCMPCGYKCLKCQVINNLSKCSLCDDGSYLDTITQSCKLCPMGAQTCVNPTNIITCMPSYLKSSNSLFCTACTPNCTTCPSTPSICTVCITGYYVSNGTCRVCNVSNCATCVAVGSAVYCSLCNQGYYRVSNTVCGGCPVNCRVCSSASVCTTCKTNYYIQGGGCSPVSTPIPNCLISSNQTTNSINKCTTCSPNYYLSSSSLQCIPCSLTCSACYGDHFGRCTACNNNSKLFNQMCLPYPYLDSNKMQIFYTPAANSAVFIGGSMMCGGLMIQGVSVSLDLSVLAAYKLVVNYKMFTDIAGQQYSFTLNSSSTNNSSPSTQSFTQSSSSTSFQLCPSSNTSLYSSVSSVTFSTVKLSNTLTIASSSSLNIYLSQLLIVAYKCSSLCTQCSQTQCFTCLTNNLYKQDAYCVYICSKGYYTYQKQKLCVQECPVGTYGLLTNVTCMDCVLPCVTCLNDQYCLSCVDGYFLNTITYTCQVSCPYRYYGSVQTQKCQLCMGRCNQCISDSLCLSCQLGFLSNQTCVDNCPVGQYQNLTSLSCQNCSSTCLICTYSPTYCVSCSAGQYLFNNTCVTMCPNGYWNSVNNGSGVCATCAYPCQKCSTSASVCLTCVDGYLLGNQCYSACPDNYYQDNVLLICSPCNISCTKCISSANNCLQCQPSLILYQSSCILTCPSTFYPSLIPSTTTTTCTKCSGLCYTCTNATYCLSCSSNFLSSSNNGSIAGQCVRDSQCFIGEYADIGTLSCRACSPSCLACLYSSTYCTACYTGFVLFNNTCLSACINNYFYQSSTNLTLLNTTTPTQICTNCQQPCLTCQSQTKCLSCIPGYKYSPSTNLCSSTCSIGSFFNTTISDCQLCSSSCLTCVSGHFCSICNTSTYLNVLSPTSNQCLSVCPNLYYADGGLCMACLYPCLQCTSNIDCVTCQNGVLYQKRCIAGCPQSTYMNVTSNTCDNCQGSCLTCKNLPTKCTSCKTGFYLIQANYTCVLACPDGTYALEITKSCIACPETCSRCLNTSHCLACIPNKTYMSPTAALCLQFCPSQYYADIPSLSCLPCPIKCLTCSSLTQCLTCSPSYFLSHLINSSYDCLPSCPSQTYPQSSICYQCTFPCLQCTNATQCVSCVAGTFYHNASRSCLMQCPLGTYYQRVPVYQCKDCVVPCLNCKDNSSCISCIYGFMLYQGKCVTQCPQGYYADGSGICNRCYGMCKTCSGKYQCLTCQTGFSYSGYCYSACPPGTYASQITSRCQPCQSPCMQCTSTATYCKKCQNSQFAYRGSCSSSCPSGTYPMGQTCQTCQFPCISCHSQFTCQQCIGGYLLYMKTSCIPNAARCPNDLYKYDSKQCVPSTWCPVNYYRDEQIKTCSYTCARQKYVDVQNKWCLSSCPDGDYVGANMVCKKWANQPPISLMGMSTIVFVKNSQVHVVVVFNQSHSWLQNSDNLYQIQNLDNSRRLLTSSSSSSTINYTQLTTQQLVLQITTMPFTASLTLPAHYILSSSTSYNLQTPTIDLHLPSTSFTAYTYEQVYTGSIMKQFSEGISWFIILFSMFFIIGNRLSDTYVLWDTAQLLYLLVFLDLQLPPNLNDFVVGLANINFMFVPSLFQKIMEGKRMVSSAPFYAHSYDNSFLRTAGSPLLIIVIVLAIFLILKFIQVLGKCSQKVKQKLDEHPKIKNYVYKGLLRFRWHHTSDVFFLSYDIVVLFAVAQISNISKNSNNIPSNVVCGIILLIYLAFPCFVSYKLYRHYKNISKGKMVANLQCFYRGIQKTNKFGISLILLRYFRKLTYCIIIAIFTVEPMFALPILTFTSVLLGLFIFINKPFKKRLSNIITITTEISLVIVFILIALIQFGQQTFNLQTKMILGWVSCGILLIMLFSLIFQVFCKSMFYLQPQKTNKSLKDINAAGNQIHDDSELKKKFSQEYIREKAGEFFDRVFPKLKQNFNLDESSQDLNEYEEGDSENSQNNQQRQKNWGLNSDSQSSRSDQFRHYGTDSESGSQTQAKQKSTQKKAPNYLIRCVKQLK